MEAIKSTPIRMMALTDRELVEALQSELSQDRQHRLQTMFFEKFRSYVFYAASQRTRNFADAGDFASDITQKTFISVFKTIKNFKLPITTSDKEYSTKVKSWLGVIANNNFNREYSKRKNTIPLDKIAALLPEPSFDLFEQMYNTIIEVPSALKKKLQEAMNLIKNDRDKHILEEYAREGCLKGNGRLSPNTLEWLSQLYNTTPENIRQIKNRTWKNLLKNCFSNT